MTTSTQKDKANQFRQLHAGPNILILPNAWDAASARIFEQAGFQAIATTSSGLAASLGYPDGEYISREMMLQAVKRITRVIERPVSVDLEAGYGNNVEEVVQTVREVIEAGAVGINIEDSTKHQEKKLVDIAYQVDLLKAIQEAAASMDVPLVVNARTDVYLLPTGDASSRFEQAVQRAQAYREAGADCIFLIGVSDRKTIADFVKEIGGAINVVGGPPAPPIPMLAELGVARVSLASGLMRAALGHLRTIASELLASGTYSSMEKEMLPGTEFRNLFGERS